MQIKNVVAGRKYITKNGEEKTRWVNVGKLFIKDDGHFSLKFEDYINPGAFKNEKGEVWFNVFDEKPKDEQPQTTGPVVGESQVVADGKAYAEHFRKVAEQQAQARAAAQQPSDEEWFNEHQEIIDALSN